MTTPRTAPILALFTLAAAAADVAAQTSPAPAPPVVQAPVATPPPPRRVASVTSRRGRHLMSCECLPPPPAEGDSRDDGGPRGVPQHPASRRHSALDDGAARQCARHAGGAAGVQLCARRGDRAGRGAVAGPAARTVRTSMPAQSSTWARTRGGASGRSSAKPARCACLPGRGRAAGARQSRLSVGPCDGGLDGGAPAGARWRRIAPRELLERARTFGESRVVCGVHHVTAVEAGRTTAEGVLAALHGVPAFRANLELAREEVSRLRGKVKPARRGLRRRRRGACGSTVLILVGLSLRP